MAFTLTVRCNTTMKLLSIIYTIKAISGNASIPMAFTLKHMYRPTVDSLLILILKEQFHAISTI